MKKPAFGWSILLVAMTICAFTSWAQEPPASPPTPPPAQPQASAPVTPPPAATPTAAPLAPKPAATAVQPASNTIVQENAQPTAPVNPSMSNPASPIKPEPITVLTMIKWGGAILWVLMAIGFVAFVLAVYLIATVTPAREIPTTFSKRVIALIRAGDLRSAYQMCEGRDELMVCVVRAGLKMAGHERYVIQEAMESEGERGIMSLTQKIFYLNNIGVVAPLVGLLGTVWGMVLAFSSIAGDNAQVKSMVVASCVSKAMICTVGGLVVAIPSLVVYYFLRGRLVKIIASVEAQASEIVELLSRGRS